MDSFLVPFKVTSVAETSITENASICHSIVLCLNVPIKTFLVREGLFTCLTCIRYATVLCTDMVSQILIVYILLWAICTFVLCVLK